jgi:hypothetical protein
MMIKKKYIILYISIVLLLVPAVNAISTTYCKDNSTLVQNTSISVNWNDIKLGDVNLESLKVCENGCDPETNTCSPSQLELILWIFAFILGFLFVVGLLAIIWKRVRM